MGRRSRGGVSAPRARDDGGALLAAIGYVVIAMAVFDVAKYFVEEEVIRGRELRNAARSAPQPDQVHLDHLDRGVHRRPGAGVPAPAKPERPTMLYPTALLLTAILIVVGLGIYQRLSADVEQKVEHRAIARPRPASRTRSSHDCAADLFCELRVQRDF